MNVMHERCAGLDVHKETVVACRRVMQGARVVREARTFATTTRGLLALADWLREAGLHARGDGVHRGLLEAGVART